LMTSLWSQDSWCNWRSLSAGSQPYWSVCWI